MTITCVSGTRFTIDHAATVCNPLCKQDGEPFDFNTDDWESDRAWLAATPGKLVVHNNIVERVLSTS